MFNILFWNLKGHAIEDYVIECIAENDVDIVLFSEFAGIDFNKIEDGLGKMYVRVRGIEDDIKVSAMAKVTICMSSIQQEKRYNVYKIETVLKKYLLAGVHLEDRRNYKNSDRIDTIQHLMADIEKTEDTFTCDNTIVIGDFNANPYDEELLSAYAFNAVLFKKVIDKNEFTNFKGEKRKRLYNPILHYISENTEMYGSFYLDGQSQTSYWWCLDQVLVRKVLANNIVNVQYLKSVGSRDLLRKDKIPNKNISDHLPLLVNIQEV